MTEEKQRALLSPSSLISVGLPVAENPLVIGTGSFGTVTRSDPAAPTPNEKLREIGREVVQKRVAAVTSGKNEPVAAKIKFLREKWQKFPQVKKTFFSANKMEVDREVSILNKSGFFPKIEEKAKSAAHFNMEAISGVSLDKFSERLTFVDRTRLMLQIVQQLHHLHGMGIIHGDVKPGNIMITDPVGDEPCSARLIDFSFSRLLEEGQQFAQIDIMGNPIYFAPEAIMPDRTQPQVGTHKNTYLLGARTDTYMLTAVLLKLLGVNDPYKTKSGLYKKLKEAEKNFLNEIGLLRMIEDASNLKNKLKESEQELDKLRLEIAKAKYNSESHQIPDIECRISLLQTNLDKIILLFINRMQEFYYPERPRDDEILKFFTLLHQFACCPEDKLEKREELGMRLWYLAAGEYTAQQDQAYSAQYVGATRWSNGTKALLGVIAGCLLINGSAAAAVMICYENFPQKTTHFLTKKIAGIEASNLEVIIAAAAVMSALIIIGGIYWYSNKYQEIAEMQKDIPISEQTDVAPVSEQPKAPSAVH